LIEVKFGQYSTDLVRVKKKIKAGSPIGWTPAEIQAGQIDGFAPDGTPVTVTWDGVAANPGWCKLELGRRRSGPQEPGQRQQYARRDLGGARRRDHPLDGYLDPYFQEVYLDATSVPIFAKLAQHVSANALTSNVAQLQGEVRKYLTKDVNYGKVAKRLYNIFRLNGCYEEAAFLRELFDEPATLLYQVWSLIRTIDDTVQPGASIAMDNVLAQADALIMAVIRVLEGDQEAEIVRNLLRLRDSLTRQKAGQELIPEAEAARAEVINIVNNFFYDKLTAMPAIKEYMDGLL